MKFTTKTESSRKKMNFTTMNNSTMVKNNRSKRKSVNITRNNNYDALEAHNFSQNTQKQIGSLRFLTEF